MPKHHAQSPATYGELRKLLAEKGNPWEPDPTKSDHEPLPTFPTGGDSTDTAVGTILGKKEIEKHFRSAPPPTHPELRAEWIAAGVLKEEESAPPAKKSSRAKTATVPAPNAGG